MGEMMEIRWDDMRDWMCNLERIVGDMQLEIRSHDHIT